MDEQFVYQDYASRMARADEKRMTAFKLFGAFGYTTIEILTEAWECSHRRTRDTLRRWVQRGVVVDHHLPASGRRLLLLTANGAAEARASLDPSIRQLVPSKIGRTTIEHNLACQRVAIELADVQYGVTLASASVDLQHDRTVTSSLEHGGQSCRPDVLVGYGDRSTIAEIELSTKTPERLRTKIEATAAIIADERRRPEMAIYFAPPGPVYDSIARVMDHLRGTATIAGHLIENRLIDLSRLT